MLRKIELWFLILGTFGLNAQTKGIVIDSLGKPIPYVGIFVENENKTIPSEKKQRTIANFTVSELKDYILVKNMNKIGDNDEVKIKILHL